MSKIKDKKVVIMRSNPVSPDSRVEKEAYALKRAGYSVQILAWDRESNHGPEINVVDVANEKIKITRFGFKAKYGAGKKSIVPYLKFQFSLRSWLKRNLEEYDIVHACDFDTAFFTFKLCKRKKKIVIFDIFDMLCTKPRNLFQRCILEAEKVIINTVDGVIICTEQRIKQLTGMKPKHIAVVHNSPFGELVGSSDGFELSQDKPKVVYVGILQEDRMLKELLDYFSKNQDLEFHTAGFGRLEELFKEYSNKFENIFFYGKIKYDLTLELEEKCDIMLAIYEPHDQNNIFAAPNKFYESLMLGKPIIMVRGTGMSEIVEEYDIGQLIDYNQESFGVGLRTLLRRRNEWNEISKKSRHIYNSMYHWDVMNKRLLKLYDEIQGDAK